MISDVQNVLLEFDDGDLEELAQVRRKLFRTLGAVASVVNFHATFRIMWGVHVRPCFESYPTLHTFLRIWLIFYFILHTTGTFLCDSERFRGCMRPSPRARAWSRPFRTFKNGRVVHTWLACHIHMYA